MMNVEGFCVRQVNFPFRNQWEFVIHIWYDSGSLRQHIFSEVDRKTWTKTFRDCVKRGWKPKEVRRYRDNEGKVWSASYDGAREANDNAIPVNKEQVASQKIA